MAYKVQDIKAAVNIVDVVSQHVSLRRAGNEYVGLCPFHNDTTPSLYVNEDKQLYLCRACSTGGDVLGFISELENLSFQEAVGELAKIAGIDITEEVADNRPQRIISANMKALELFRKRPPVDWVTERGYDKSFADDWQIGYAPKSGKYIYHHALGNGWLDDALLAGLVKKDEKGQHYDFFRDRVIFPIFVSKRLVGFGGRDFSGFARAKYLNTAENAVYNKSRVLYGIDAARRAGKRRKELVVGEGYMDEWAFHRGKLPNSVATGGVALTQQHATMLSRLVDGVVLCYDGDQAGEKATMRALGVCFGAGLPVRIARPPDGSDPDDMDPKELARIIKEAPDAIRYYKDKYGDLAVRHKKRLIEQLGKFISECPNRTLKDISIDQVKSLFKVDVSVANSKDDAAVDVLQRAVYAIMQSGDNAEPIFNDLPPEAIRGNIALQYLYECWKGEKDQAEWVSGAAENVRKRLVAAMNQLFFSERSVIRIRLLILDRYYNNLMSSLEEKIATAEAIDSSTDKYVVEWEDLNKKRSKVNADLRVSL